MPITPQEVVTLSTQSLELIEALRSALAPDGDGGKRITRAEGRKVIQLTLSLATALVRDVLD